MKQMLYNKKYSGIILAIIIASVFVGISLCMRQVLSGAFWFLFSSILRVVFGFIILFLLKKIYGRSIKDVLSIKGSKMVLVKGWDSNMFRSQVSGVFQRIVSGTHRSEHCSVL